MRDVREVEIACTMESMLKKITLKSILWAAGFFLFGLLIVKPFEQAFEETFQMKEIFKPLLSQMTIKEVQMTNGQAHIQINYVVSMGYVNTKIHANMLIKELKSHNFKSWIHQASDRGFLIYVGPYSEKKGARIEADRIKYLLGKWPTILKQEEFICDQ